MSILIKMEMPKNCDDCPFCATIPRAYTTLAYCFLQKGKPNQDDCPLIHIPPHGRLIDADAFMEYECHHCDGYCDVCECDCLNCKSEHRCSFMQDLDDAPTIIESEGEDG